MDALIAYMQMLGTLVDTTTFKADIFEVMAMTTYETLRHCGGQLGPPRHVRLL